MSSAQYLGIDVGGTNVKMGVVDAKTGQITNFYSHDTDSWRQSGHFMEQFADAIAGQLYANKDVKKGRYWFAGHDQPGTHNAT